MPRPRAVARRPAIHERLGRPDADDLRGIARGPSTPHIAAEPFLSSHAVRDYIKSLFEMVGVSSRGERSAKLFAEHYSVALQATLVRVQ